MDPVFDVLSKKSLPNPNHLNCLLCYLLGILKVFILHLFLCSILSSFLWWLWSLCLGSFFAVDNQLFSTICWGDYLGSTVLFCSFVKDQLAVYMWLCVWALYSAALIYLSVLPWVPHCLNSYSFMVRLVLSVLQLCSASVLHWFFWV